MQLSVLQVFLSSQSAVVAQTLPQPLIAVWLHWPLPAVHESVVQGFKSSHGKAFPVQVPPAQASLTVQLLLSLQVTPSMPAWCTHWPFWPTGLQVSTVQGLLSLQSFCTPVHTPAWQVSLAVHALPVAHWPPVVGV